MGDTRLPGRRLILPILSTSIDCCRARPVRPGSTLWANQRDRRQTRRERDRGSGVTYTATRRTATSRAAMSLAAGAVSASYDRKGAVSTAKVASDFTASLVRCPGRDGMRPGGRSNLRLAGVLLLRCDARDRRRPGLEGRLESFRCEARSMGPMLERICPSPSLRPSDFAE